MSIDDELANEGVPVIQRPYRAARIWGEQTGDPMIGLTRESWFRGAYAKLHPSVPFSSESFLTLCVSARAVSYLLKPPMGYGRFAVKPLQYVEISDAESRRLFHDHPGAFWDLQWQACDGVDLFMALVNYQPSNRAASNMMATAVHQMTASARQLVACEIDASLPQGMAMAVELAGKSVLSAQGASDAELRRLGHDLKSITSHVSSAITSPVDTDVRKVALSLPRYVDVRYDAPEMNMLDAQDVYRRALFVIADFLRRTNHDQLYWKLRGDPSVPTRVW